MKKKIILLAILFSAVLLGMMITLLIILQNESQWQEANISVEKDTIESVCREYDVKYIDKKGTTINVELPKDLFDENGESNKEYIINFTDDLKQFFKRKTFYVIDEEKEITIELSYDVQTEKYTLIINGKKDFYDVIDGKQYSEVENVNIGKLANLYVQDDILGSLEMKNSFFESIEESLGEGTQLDNGYTSYLNGKVRVRLSPIKTVKNIIFSEDYDGIFTIDIDFNSSLKDIYNKNQDNEFGSVEEGYLGYISEDFYIFFYDDETSIYSYTYAYNHDFESLLKEYIETKNLDQFVNALTKRWKVYDKFEYDAEKQDAYILYANRGIEIDIKNNNPKGITLYKNFYFTEDVEKLVKNGEISFNYKEDLLFKKEMERINSR